MSYSHQGATVPCIPGTTSDTQRTLGSAGRGLRRLRPRVLMQGSDTSDEHGRVWQLTKDPCPNIQNKATGIQRQVITPLREQALDLFLSSTILHCDRYALSSGHFVGLPFLLESCTESDGLLPALEAVALASYAHRFDDFGLRTQGVHQYNVAIRRLRKTDFSDRSKTRSVIACILLLGIYEVQNRPI